MTIRLHLLRHGDAAAPDSWAGPDDDRPLTPEGRRQAERLGRFLRTAGFETDAIVSSPKVRARETAELIGAALACEVTIDEALGSGPGLGEIDTVLGTAGNPARPILVGHDPEFSKLAAALVGAPDLPMRKGAFVRIDAERPLAVGGGTLRWLVPPDLLSADD
jgi:phosphohistidine phosphatase